MAPAVRRSASARLRPGTLPARELHHDHGPHPNQTGWPLPFRSGINRPNRPQGAIVSLVTIQHRIPLKDEPSKEYGTVFSRITGTWMERAGLLTRRTDRRVARSGLVRGIRHPRRNRGYPAASRLPRPANRRQLVRTHERAARRDYPGQPLCLSPKNSLNLINHRMNKSLCLGKSRPVVYSFPILCLAPFQRLINQPGLLRIITPCPQRRLSL